MDAQRSTLLENVNATIFDYQRYNNLLAKPFDFSIEESINTDYEKQSYAKTDKDLKERWRKQLKLSLLSTIADKQKVEKNKKEKDPKYKEKSFDLPLIEPRTCQSLLADSANN